MHFDIVHCHLFTSYKEMNVFTYLDTCILSYFTLKRMENGMFKGRSLFCVVHLSIWSINVIKDGPLQTMYFLTHVVSHL
jgi:hypothetical protein